jgi:mannose-6-phosphate isomerase-like protein (cupin superfamily)
MITARFTALALFIMITLISSGCSGKKEILKRDYSPRWPITQVNPAILSADDTTWSIVNDRTRRKVYFNDRLTMEVLEVSKSEASKDISLTHRIEDTLGYVLEGNFIVTINKETKQVNQGGVYIIPSNVPHSIIASSSKATVMNVYTPPREDLRPAPAEIPRFNENDVKSLAYRWFGLLDEKAPADSLHGFLSVQDFYMELPDKKMTSAEAFENNYKNQLRTLEWRTSELGSINVFFKGKGEYTIDISLTTTEKLFDKSSVKKKFKESWVVIDTGEPMPRIKQRIVKEIK